MKQIEKWLYVNEHMPKKGKVTRRYYAIFQPWNRETSVTWPLGGDETSARAELKWLRDLNQAKVEVLTHEQRERRDALQKLEAEKEQKRQGIRFRDWIEMYFDEMVEQRDGQEVKFRTWSKGLKRLSTVHGEELRQKPLLDFFGDKPLVEIDYNLIEEYKTYRAPYVQVPTTNRELSLLRFLLTVAVKRRVLTKAIPLIEMQDESGRARERSVTEEEYHDIRAGMRRETERVVIGWWETSTRHEEPFNTRWPMVDLKVGLFRLPTHILKEKFPRRTPISYEMREVLEELRDEQRRNKVENIQGHVFTRRDGRPIRDITKAFAFALERAKLQNSGITPHSFRRACISRWTDLGIPRDFVMLFSGHKPTGVHDEYLRFTDAMLIGQFREKGLLLPPEQRKTAKSV